MEITIGFGTTDTYAGHRLREMIEQRMAETGESQSLAEMNVVRTKQGAELWDEERQHALGEGGARTGENRAQSGNLQMAFCCEQSAADKEFAALVSAEMGASGRTMAEAEAAVARTETGAALWERARQESLRRG